MSRTLAVWLAFSCLALGCAADAGATDESAHADTTPAAPRGAATNQPATAEELSQPTLSSAMHDGDCASQADCPHDNVCMAVMPGVSHCVPGDFAGAPDMEAAPNGRPGAPVGLLDGQVLRDQVMRDQPIPVSQP